MILCCVESPCRLTQPFGANPEEYAQYGLKGHEGIDFAGPRKGFPVTVYSPYDAEVWEVGDQGKQGYGKYVRLRTAPDQKGFRREVVLAHLQRIDVKFGRWLALAEPVGLMGTTGHSSALHVHMGLRRVRPDGRIDQHDNGYRGYLDYGPYLIFWKKDREGMVSLVH